MPGQFIAAISRDGESLERRSNRSELEVRQFEGGYLLHAAGVSVHEAPEALCLACGEPRFEDSRYADLAASINPAAAWLAVFRDRRLDAPNEVRGRFAAVLFRHSEHTALAATDRFGTWPLCYAACRDRFLIGQRADDVAGAGAAASPQAIYDYVFFHVIPAPLSVFEGVSRVPAGHALQWRDGELTCKRYWHPEFAERTAPNLADCEGEFLRIIEAAVAREAVGSETGSYLSGGTDSSTISGMLGQVTGRPARTYSIGFAAEGYDEMEYARIAARHFNTEHHEYYVTPNDLVEGIPRIAQHFDQPFGNSSAVPAFVCAERARQDGIEKLLAGDGGDELFAGNTRYAKQRVFERYGKLPGVVRRHVLEPISELPLFERAPLLRKVGSYVRQARVPMPDRLQSYNMLLRLGPEAVFEPAFLAAVDQGSPFAIQRRTWSAIEPCSLVNRMLAFDWVHTLADNDLPKVIGTARLAGVEVGFPLLSDELVDFSLRVPPEWKLRGRALRWFFKHALRDFLPKAVLTKQKHGFGLPFGVWVSGHEPLSSLAGDALRELGQRGIIREGFVTALMRDYLPAHPGYYGEMVWILMILELWLRQQLPGWRFSG